MGILFKQRVCDPDGALVVFPVTIKMVVLLFTRTYYVQMSSLRTRFGNATKELAIF